MEIMKLDLESKDLIAERIEQMKALFPEIVVEGDGSIDFEKLRLILGDEVDEGKERYAFTWPGKADAIRQSQMTSSATLRPCVDQSVGRDGESDSFDTENIYIEGDNLEVLKLLQRGYHGKVKMIYIDPPYNTGKEFVYKDSFQDTIENYKKQCGLVGQSNADTSGRYHSDWLSMMYPRLRLARELLSDDGVMLLSINDYEENTLRMLCNEIFGLSNFVCTFNWNTKKAAQGMATANMVVPNHEYVLAYAKDISLFKFRGLDRDGSSGFANPDNDPRGLWKRQYLQRLGQGLPKRTIIDPSTGNAFTFETPYTQDKLDRWIEEGRIIFPDTTDRYPARKEFLAEYENLQQLVTGLGLYATKATTEKLYSLFNDEKVFTNPKPDTLIEFFVQQTTGQDDLILDYFSGSATSGQAIFQQTISDGLRRRFILVQMPEKLQENSAALKFGIRTISELGEERLRRAGQKIKAEIEDENKQLKLGEETKKLPDIGFRVFKLEESCIERPEEGRLVVNRVKDGCSDLDIIFEMMLKWGLELSLPVEKTEINGYPVYEVAAGELICCMEPGLTNETLNAIAEEQPRRVFILDSVLTDELKLNAVKAFKRVSDETQQEIELRTV